MLIDQVGFETIRIIETGGDDTIVVLDEGESDVQVVHNRPGCHRDGGPHQVAPTQSAEGIAGDKTTSTPDHDQRGQDGCLGDAELALMLAGAAESIDPTGGMDMVVEMLARDSVRRRR